MTQTEAEGTLVVRVTLTPAICRSLFARDVIWAIWAVASIVVVVANLQWVEEWPWWWLAALLIVGYSSWGLWRTARSAHTKFRVFSMGVPSLVLDELGVTVRDVPLQPDGARLSWSDCAAVVVSKAPRDSRWIIQPRRYLHFVPLSEDRVEGTVRRRTPRHAILPGIPETSALLVWLELPGLVPGADDVVDWIRAHQPDAKLIGRDYSVTDE